MRILFADVFLLLLAGNAMAEPWMSKCEGV